MALEKFQFEHDGKKYSLPLMSNLKFGVVRKLRKETESEQMFLLVEEVADKRTLTAIDDMTGEAVGELFEAWQKASGIDVGESEDSEES